MRTAIIQFGAACAILICSAVPLLAEPCADARKTVDETIAVAPKADTEEKIQSALKMCPGNASFYNVIGDYYNAWLKKEINPEKQASYNFLATEYYAKGIKLGKGKDYEAMRRKLAALESSTEDITEVGIRSIKPGARLNIRVYFEFNSSELSKEAQEELDVLGRYLGDAKSSHIVLEGHTDMVGGEQYNLELSKKRAQSAKEYLVKKFGVGSASIETQGYGFERLADVDDPYSAKNRRVRVRKLSN
jgi:outer membrane protein OmpA-like peptidoglycan-associated protein